MIETNVIVAPLIFNILQLWLTVGVHPNNYRIIFKIKSLDVIIMRVIHSDRLLGMRLFGK